MLTPLLAASWRHGRVSRVGAGHTVHAGAASEFVHVEVTVATKGAAVGALVPLAPIGVADVVADVQCLLVLLLLLCSC